MGASSLTRYAVLSSLPRVASRRAFWRLKNESASWTKRTHDTKPDLERDKKEMERVRVRKIKFCGGYQYSFFLLSLPSD